MNAQEVKNFYDRCFQDYDEHMHLTGHYIAQERILEKLKDHIKQPMLDMACGTGFLYRKLTSQYNKVFANDFSEKMSVSLAKEGVVVTHDSAETLVSYKSQFRTLISCNLFYYIQNKPRALERWYELLEENGKLVLIEEYPFITPESNEMDEHVVELMKIVNPTSIDSIKKEVTEHGFVFDKMVSIEIDDKHDLYGIVFRKM